MANVTSSNPISLDTAVANWAALNLPGSSALNISKIEWFAPATIGDTFVIKDNSTTPVILLEGKCEVALQSQVFNFNPPLKWSKATGWFLQQISSGKIYVYIA